MYDPWNDELAQIRITNRRAVQLLLNDLGNRDLLVAVAKSNKVIGYSQMTKEEIAQYLVKRWPGVVEEILCGWRDEELIEALRKIEAKRRRKWQVAEHLSIFW